MSNPLAYMHTPQPAKKDNARKAEEMFRTMVEGFARNGEVQGRPFTIIVEPNNRDQNGGTYNRYKVPGEGEAELTVEFRNFSVNEFGANMRPAPVHSPSNMAMIASITEANKGNTLAFILFRMNDIVRKCFKNGFCYYVMQNSRHMEHFFFYHDRDDDSMIVVRFKMGYEAVKRSYLSGT